jgi:hypothetical protein
LITATGGAPIRSCVSNSRPAIIGIPIVWKYPSETTEKPAEGPVPGAGAGRSPRHTRARPDSTHGQKVNRSCRRHLGEFPNPCQHLIDDGSPRVQTRAVFRGHQEHAQVSKRSGRKPRSTRLSSMKLPPSNRRRIPALTPATSATTRALPSALRLLAMPRTAQVPIKEESRILGKEIDEAEQDLLFERCLINGNEGCRIRPYDVRTGDGGTRRRHD